MRALPVALALSIAVASSAHAERFLKLTGAKLIETCTSRDKGVIGDCTAYIEGISDAISFYQVSRPADGSKGGRLPDYICVPTAVAGPQLRDTVIAYAKANPDKLGIQASGIVIRALNDKYSCPGERGAK